MLETFKEYSKEQKNKTYRFIRNTLLLTLVGLSGVYIEKEHALSEKIRTTYHEHMLKKNAYDCTGIKKFDDAFSHARKNNVTEFVWINKYGKLEKYNTKLIEEVQPGLKEHLETYSLREADFFSRPSVLRTLSKTTTLSESVLSEMIHHRLHTITIKERIGEFIPTEKRLSQNKRFGVYNYISGELYAEFGGGFSGYPHEKMHALDLGITSQNCYTKIISHEMAHHLRNMIDGEKLNQLEATGMLHGSHGTHGEGQFAGYLFSPEELFSRVMTINWYLESTLPLDMFTRPEYKLTKDHINHVGFHTDVSDFLKIANYDRVLHFINSLHGKNNYFFESITSQDSSVE